jgi:hypothetical protein
VPTTLVATPEPANDPPRILLELTYTGQTEATIVRTDPDGSQVPVRLAEPATLDGAGSWVGYDYESWFEGDTSYTATTGAGSVTSSTVSLDVTDVWLRHPGIPSLSQQIDFQGDGAPVRPVVQAVLEPLGRIYPVVVSDGRRKAKRGEITIRTKLDAEHTALAALVDDVTPLLLDVPPSKGFGVDLTHQYLAIADLTQSRLRPDYYPHPWRIWTAPYIVVGRPAGDLQSERTYATILADHATYQELVTTYATYTELLTGV